MGGVDKIIKDGPCWDRETPEPDETTWPRVGLIIGHTLGSPGAVFRGPGFKHEYDYNRDIAYKAVRYAEQIDAPLRIYPVFRDEIGISGAYKVAIETHKVDMIIELHFNSFSNTSVRGTETLCTNDQIDKNFATIIQHKMCTVFERERMSRGVKTLPRSARGGFNIHQAPGVANCLVEPFFGSSLEDAQLGFEKRTDYAQALVEGCLAYARIAELTQ